MSETIVNRKKLVEALSKAAPALGTNDLIPAFKCYQFDVEACEVVATDGVLVIRTPLPKEFDIDCAVPGAPFKYLLESLDSDTVILHMEDKNLIIQTGNKKVKGTFACAEKCKVPAIPEITDYTKEDYSDLFEGLEFAKYCASKDETAGALCGVCVDGTMMLSSDRYRIVVYQLKSRIFSGSISMPLKFVNVLLKYKSNVNVISNEDCSKIYSYLDDGTKFGSALLSGKYPNLMQYIPSDLSEFQIIRFSDTLIDVVDRHIDFLRNVNPIDKEINISVRKDECCLTTVDKQLGVLQESVKLMGAEGEELSFLVNPLFIKEISKICSSLYYDGLSKTIVFATDKLKFYTKSKVTG